uniref:Uncharacterized protein n=1 Tax=Oryza brachyantha TaxID=4533 RepID=J3N8Y8_ORYBR
MIWCKLEIRRNEGVVVSIMGRHAIYTTCTYLGGNERLVVLPLPPPVADGEHRQRPVLLRRVLHPRQLPRHRRRRHHHHTDDHHHHHSSSKHCHRSSPATNNHHTHVPRTTP